MNIYTTNITNDSGRGGRDNAKENTVDKQGSYGDSSGEI